MVSKQQEERHSSRRDNKLHIIYCKNIESSVLKALCNLFRRYTEIYKLPTGCLQEKNRILPPGTICTLLTGLSSKEGTYQCRGVFLYQVNGIN